MLADALARPDWLPPNVEAFNALLQGIVASINLGTRVPLCVCASVCVHAHVHVASGLTSTWARMCLCTCECCCACVRV